MSNDKFLIWGAKGHAKVLDEIIRLNNGSVIALVDQDANLKSPISNLKIIDGYDGYIAWLNEMKVKNPHNKISAVAAMGGNKGRDRLRYFEMFKSDGFLTPNIIHPTSHISDSSVLGENNQLCAFSFLGPNSRIGNACIINTKATLDHDSVLEDGVHLAPGVTICGEVKVGSFSFIATGATIMPNLSIGTNSMVGSGSLVTKDVPDNVLVYGNPARMLEQKLSQLMSSDISLQSDALNLFKRACDYKYSYNFTWMSRPIIQFPQDIVAMQELVWKVKPDLIIETGIAHGGSLIMNASLLAMLDYIDAMEAGELLDPNKPKRLVLGIDIDIREHNRKAIEAHPMSNRIDMIQGSSIAEDIVNQVKAYAKNYKSILVSLDSNHTHDHVLEELEAYAPLTSLGSYCVVFDTVVEDMPKEMFPDRPWGPGDNPKTAVWEYLKEHPEFEIDKSIQNKLLITVAPDGYLKRVS